MTPSDHECQCDQHLFRLEETGLTSMVGDDLASFSSSYPVIQASSFSGAVFLTFHVCSSFQASLPSYPFLGMKKNEYFTNFLPSFWCLSKLKRVSCQYQYDLASHQAKFSKILFSPFYWASEPNL